MSASQTEFENDFFSEAERKLGIVTDAGSRRAPAKHDVFARSVVAVAIAGSALLGFGAPTLARTAGATRGEFIVPLQSEVGRLLSGLQTLAVQIRERRPLAVDDEARALARQVARKLGSNQSVDVDTWAEKLAGDFFDDDMAGKNS